MKSPVNYTWGMNFSRGRLRGHRNGLRLSQVELGGRVHMPVDCIETYETGQVVPDDVTVAALAAALGVPVDSLCSQGRTWTEDYVNAALSHAAPLEAQDIDRAARALRRTA